MTDESTAPYFSVGIDVPDNLYMVRKTFEFGTATLTRSDVQSRSRYLLSRLPKATDSEIEELDRYWTLEQALYEVLAKGRHLRYDQYLPGRSYTYRQLARIIDGLTSRPPEIVVDVGCGSALLSHYISPTYREYLALDVSVAALRLAALLASDHNSTVTPMRASAFNLPFTDGSIDTGASLGLLEHFPHEIQVRIVSETIRVCSDVAIFAVPNTASAIFATMAALERQEAGSALQFPLEEHYFAVDFDSIAVDCGARLITHGAFHVVSPHHIPADKLSEQERLMFSNLIADATDAYSGSAFDAWSAAEAALPRADRDRWGWFAYGVFSCVG